MRALIRAIGISTLLLMAPLTKAQTAPAPSAIAAFWPVDEEDGTVYLGGHSRQKGETEDQSVQRVRLWLIAYTSDWEEVNTGQSKKLFFSATLRGLHPGVELCYDVAIRLESEGFRFFLTHFRIGAPTAGGRQQWHDLRRVLDDPDFRADVMQFEEELAQALANL